MSTWENLTALRDQVDEAVPDTRAFLHEPLSDFLLEKIIGDAHRMERIHKRYTATFKLVKEEIKADENDMVSMNKAQYITLWLQYETFVNETAAYMLARGWFQAFTFIHYKAEMQIALYEASRH